MRSVYHCPQRNFSPFHGFSVEFAEHRLYNTGESTRHIDWKLFARTEKLFVKKYEEETNLRCQVVIDNSSSMYFPEDATNEPDSLNKIGFSIYCAASLTYLLRKQRDAVGLSVFGEELEVHTPAKSSIVHHKYLYGELEALLHTEAALKKTFAVDALHQIADKIHKRSLVVIFSDMMDNSTVKRVELFAAMQHLRHNKHEVILFHVADKKKETDFEFENRPYTFVDKETGEEVKAHPAAVKDEYVKAVKAHEKELKLRCGQYQIDFVKTDINESFEQVLLAYLVKRSNLY